MSLLSTPAHGGLVRPLGFAAVIVAVLMAAGCAGDQRPSESAPARAVPDTGVTTAGDITMRTSMDSTAATDSSDALSAKVDTAVGPVGKSVLPANASIDNDRIGALIAEVSGLKAEVASLRASEARAKPASVDTARVSARERVKETAQDVQNFGFRTFWAVVMITAAFFLIKFLVWLLESLSERSARRRLFFKKLIPITRILVWTIVVYYIIAVVYQVDKDGLLAAGAAVGVAVGFAAQDVLKNIFGGILIILDQPFQVGDRVRVGGTYGEVVSIGLRSTRIVTPDDNLVSVPNTQVVDGQVANANAGALDCQVVTELYLPGWVDVSRAKEIAYDAAANSKFVFLKKPIVVLIQDEFKETFLTRIVVKAYVIDARYEARFASDVTETAKMQYLREGMLAEFYPGAAALVDGEDANDLHGGLRS